MTNVLALQSMTSAHDDVVITSLSSLASAVCCNTQQN
ncbi:class III lanthipeptide [Shewanella khirikhana]|uniref:Uncharacterized protein n=1 Tax=Shewanella khirikhana TaxID=1965282 RepID=A0ABN5U026_9GAMM|nr:class III lanthipeptide [Shewanella khirikhana]AZQ12587.1 hypothetical protein STH12_03528 [Shewanella khirikhana]AZQ12588.1 hypothetical protein STH12_03529 [Shewanella khirikhana]AZQ12589.1 hypothetical protein STH12_03530 [Shewanella khirikhana]AZQ12590.1 hypothetical protein STH12_03531 [Shewanella khirikhana]AZQ12591.1 hypothetical protein STH12_03532 [Shewanella khirikhana]